MLANDVSLRNLIPAELAKGFGFFQSKPATAFSPVAVTPDELGDAWHGGRLHLDAAKHLERPQGRPVRRRPGDDLPLRPADRPHLQDAQRARRRIVGSGTVSNKDVERRLARATPASPRSARSRRSRTASPQTEFMKFGDTIRIEMKDSDGQSLFGAIEQKVVAAEA